MTIFTMQKLHKAYVQCLKHKKDTANALKFEINRERNLASLLSDLKTGKYEISRHMCFVVTEPTPREIFAGDFRDRVVHHLLYNEIEGMFERDFIDESYANRNGRGTHMAVKKLKFHIVRGGKNRQRLYCLKMDIKGFFRNIDKEKLFEIVEKRIVGEKREEWWEREVLSLTKKIIFHDPVSNYFFKGKVETRRLVPKEKSLLYGDKSKGLPIGNLTSQFFANVYINELDHFIKENLGFPRYIRYVDDFMVLDEDVEKLKRAVVLVEKFLQENLKLSLCKDKTILRPTEQGIDFLGYYIKPTHALVRRKVVKRFKKRLYQCGKDENGFLKVSDIPMIQSYLGHFKHAHSYNLREKLLG